MPPKHSQSMGATVDEPLEQLMAELAPLSDEKRAALLTERRLARLNDCLVFKQYIWGITVLIFIVDMWIRIAFGAVNLASAVTPFGNPLAIAASFTAIAAFFAVLFMVIDFLYTRKFIGCDGLELTPRELESMEKYERSFFIPGCVYDCRMIQNRIDFNTIRYFLVLGMTIVLINVWVNEPKTSAPDLGTPEGIRYACSHLLSFGVQMTILLCIIMNIFSLYRRRPRVETLHIHFWFEVHRYWSEDAHAAPGVILQ